MPAPTRRSAIVPAGAGILAALAAGVGASCDRCGGVVAAVYLVPMSVRLRSLRVAVCRRCFDRLTGAAPWRLYTWPDDALSEPERTYAELQAAARDLEWLLSQCDATLLTEGVTLAQLLAEAARLEERQRQVVALLTETPSTRAN